jgi:hypothetical protein
MSTSTQMRVIALLLAAQVLESTACGETPSPYAGTYAATTVAVSWSAPYLKPECEKDFTITVNSRGGVQVGALTTTLDAGNCFSVATLPNTIISIHGCFTLDDEGRPSGAGTYLYYHPGTGECLADWSAVRQ